MTDWQILNSDLRWQQVNCRENYMLNLVIETYFHWTKTSTHIEKSEFQISIHSRFRFLSYFHLFPSCSLDLPHSKIRFINPEKWRMPYRQADRQRAMFSNNILGVFMNSMVWHAIKTNTWKVDMFDFPLNSLSYIVEDLIIKSSFFLVVFKKKTPLNEM